MKVVIIFIPVIIIILLFAVDRCTTNTFFQVLNQPQESSLLPGRLFSRADLYTRPSYTPFGSLFQSWSNSKHKKSKKYKKHDFPKKSGLNIYGGDLLDEENKAPRVPVELAFPVLNAKPDDHAISEPVVSKTSVLAKLELSLRNQMSGMSKGRSSTERTKKSEKLRVLPLVDVVEDDGKPSKTTPGKRSYSSGDWKYLSDLEKAKGAKAAQEKVAPVKFSFRGRAAANPGGAVNIEDSGTTAAVLANGTNNTSGADATVVTAMASSGDSTGNAKQIPFLDFNNAGDGSGGSRNDSVGGAGIVIGLSQNFTMEEYEIYCGVEDNERRKRICPWTVGMNGTDQDDNDNEKDPPLDLNDLFDPSERASADKVVAAEVHQIAAHNRKLMIETIKGAIWGNEADDTEPVNGFKLLNMTKRIFAKICPFNVVSPKFLNMVYIAFKRLHDITTPGRQAFISDFEHEMIDSVLDQCFANSKPANYIQNDCKEDVVAVNSTKHVLCLGFILTEGVNRSTACYQTNSDVYDPILDVIWLMFEAVKANCFEFFQGNIRLLHRYSVAVKDMFSRPLKSRWPLQRETMEYWQRLLGPGTELALNNIDKCVHHIVKTSKFDFRTPRFFNVNSVQLSHTHVQFLKR